MYAALPHAIFACVVLATDLANLLGKALVGCRWLFLAALAGFGWLPSRRLFPSSHDNSKLCWIGREFKTGL
jgi:hypothetical protein